MKKIQLPNGVEITLSDDRRFEVAVMPEDAESELDVRTSSGITTVAARLVRIPLPEDGKTIEVIYRRRRFGRITRYWRKVFEMKNGKVEETPQS